MIKHFSKKNPLGHTNITETSQVAELAKADFGVFVVRTLLKHPFVDAQVCSFGRVCVCVCVCVCCFFLLWGSSRPDHLVFGCVNLLGKVHVMDLSFFLRFSPENLKRFMKMGPLPQRVPSRSLT